MPAHARTKLLALALALALVAAACQSKGDAAPHATPTQAPPAAAPAPSAPLGSVGADEGAPTALDPTVAMLERLASSGPPVRLLASRSLERGLLQHFVLANGLEVVVLEDHSFPVVAYQTWFRVGSRNDPPGREGLAHLTEHLMFRRTESMPDGEFDLAMESLGIDPDANTWLDHTVYFQKVPAAALSTVARIEAERMHHLAVDPPLLEAERAVVLRERGYRIDNDPQGSLTELLYQMAFGDHPYGRQTVGTEAGLRAIELADVEALRRAAYQPGNSAIVLVGAVDTAQALATLREAYGHIPGQGRLVDNTNDAPLPDSHRSEVLAMPIDAELLLLGFPAPAFTDPDALVMAVLNEALFGDPAGAVYRELKLQRELVVDLQGWAGEFRNRSLFEVLVVMRPGENHREARRRILVALSEVARDGLDDDALRRAQNRLELREVLAQQDFGELAERLGQRWAVGAEPAEHFGRIAAFKAITSADVARVASTWLRPGALVETLAIPKE